MPQRIGTGEARRLDADQAEKARLRPVHGEVPQIPAAGDIFPRPQLHHLGIGPHRAKAADHPVQFQPRQQLRRLGFQFLQPLPLHGIGLGKGPLAWPQQQAPLHRGHGGKPLALFLRLVKEDVPWRRGSFIQNQIVRPVREDTNAGREQQLLHLVSGKPGTVDDYGAGEALLRRFYNIIPALPPKGGHRAVQP